MKGATLVLRLYVAGDGPNSTAARRHIEAFLARKPRREIELEIVDVLDEPERGLRDGVLVTPMLVRLRPGPERRVVGNLRDESALMAALGSEERST
jgi:circadian clock protein KaiB